MNEDPRLRLEVVAGPAAGLKIGVEDRLLIGRGSDGPGRLGDDPELSRQHAEITRQGDGTYSLEDLGSTNGTVVNGTRLTAPVVLVNGDSIEAGGSMLSVASAPTPPAPPRAETITVEVPTEMRSSAPPPPPTTPVIPPPPAPAPAAESVPPPAPPPEPLADPEPFVEPEPIPAPESAPPPAPLAEPEPFVEPEPIPAPESAPPPEPAFEPEPEPAFEPEPPSAAIQPEPPTELMPPPEPEPVVEPEPAAPPPKLALRLVFDPESGEAEIHIDEQLEPIRLVHRDGAWHPAN